MSITRWQNPTNCPEARPSLGQMSETTRTLHTDIDDHIRKSGVAYLHPTDKTVLLDLFSSKQVIDWQEAKVEFLFSGEGCWSELPQLYARYGTHAGQTLLQAVRELEGASSALACDSGMQAAALVFDVLLERNSHAIMFRQVYNKTAKYLSWLAERTGCKVSVVDDGDLDAMRAAVRPNTVMVFAETYSNPLMRALDLDKVPAMVKELRSIAPRMKLVVDSTIATAWGIRGKLLDLGVDVVLFSGTKAFGGQDRDLSGFIATNDSDLANAAMDLLAMRGGILDWRRADALLQGLATAKDAHERRCEAASLVAAFLDRHPLVEEVFHPSLPNHVDADAIARGYQRYGSLLSFRLKGGDEEAARRVCDVMAMTQIIRYAVSFDGLTTKVNHHKSVSEYFTPDDALRRSGIHEIVRLGIGLEDPDDLCAAINWSLHMGSKISDEELARWRDERRRSLGL